MVFDLNAVVETAKPQSRRRVGLASVLVAAVLLRVYRLDSESLWIDEIYSVAIRGDAPVAQLLTASDPHPPLYYLILNGWVRVFGNGAVAVRLLSVLFGVLGVLGLYLLGCELYDARVGLVAAGLLTVSPMHVQSSREVRMYAMLVALVVAATWLYVRVLDEDRWVLDVGYVVTALAMLYTHLFAMFVLAVHGLHALWVWYRGENGRSGAAIGLQLLAAETPISRGLEPDHAGGIRRAVGDPGHLGARQVAPSRGIGLRSNAEVTEALLLDDLEFDDEHASHRIVVRHPDGSIVPIHKRLDQIQAHSGTLTVQPGFTFPKDLTLA
ncbi:MAG: hypothetical protein ACI9EZ_002260, partial [Halobacteriales archaeon]